MSTADPKAEVELLEHLGEGSFSNVYVARVSAGVLRRTVVLKILKRDWVKNDQTLKRARDEAVLLARLNHAHIVRVEQLVNLGGRPVLVMEHIEGLTLDRVLAHHGPLPVGVALRVASQVASALDAAVNRTPPGEEEPLRVIHRDIKPSNILLSVDGLVKVLDFGTARATFEDREASTHRTAMGSLNYMPPESVEHGDPTPAVDIYALGATLYELVGRHPLGRLSVRPERHRQGLAERLEKLNPADLSGGPALQGLRELLGRMLVYEADRRPSAREVLVAARALATALPCAQSDVADFAEQVVAPMYRSRQATPPAPVEGLEWARAGRRLRRGDSLSEPVTDDASAPPATPYPLLIQRPEAEEPGGLAETARGEAPSAKGEPRHDANPTAPGSPGGGGFWPYALAVGALGVGLLLGRFLG